MADDDLPLDLLRVVREHFPGVPDADLSVALRNRLDGGPDSRGRGRPVLARAPRRCRRTIRADGRRAARREP